MTLLSLLLSSHALACGGMVPVVGQVVSSDAQQALFRLGPAGHSVEYRVRYTGSAEDFAWIIPVVGTITGVDEGSEATFDQLAELTGPVIIDLGAEEEPGCGCLGPSKGDGGDLLDETTGVVITGSGFAGAYSYVTLQAEDADGLMTWLVDHGYDGTIAADDIAAYVADPRGVEWVAVQVQADLLDEDVMFSPLKVSYGPAADGLLHAEYPARMARTSTAETDRIELYVMAQSGVDLGGGWTAVTPNTIEVATVGEAAEAYAAELARIGDVGRAFVWVWAGEAGSLGEGAAGFLTRFDTIVDPAAQTTDPVFTETGLTWNQSVTIEVGAVDETSRASLGLLTIGLLLARRRAARVG